MKSHSNGLSSQPSRGRKTAKVCLANLVPRSEVTTKHFAEIDQAAFMIYCMSPESGKGRTGRVFSVYDLLQIPAFMSPQAQRTVRELGRVAVERAYMIYRRFLSLKKRRGDVRIHDAITAIERSGLKRRFANFMSKAKALMRHLSRLSAKFRAACKQYGPERILDGFVSTMPPWVVSPA